MTIYDIVVALKYMQGGAKCYLVSNVHSLSIYWSSLFTGTFCSPHALFEEQRPSECLDLDIS